MQRLEKSIVVAAPPQVIWDLSVDPARWHTWFEGLSQPKSIQGDGGQGTVVEHDITVNGISIPLKTTVVTFEPGCCWKAEYTGLMTKGSQQWTYSAADAGTELVFVMETELSGPAKVAEKMVVNAFDEMTDKMLANLKEQVEGN
jgi:carbon monoxide dehydrogenase subunit G